MFKSYNEVKCPLPSKGYYRVEVSFNRNKTSNSKTFMSFNPICLHCDVELEKCIQKVSIFDCCCCCRGSYCCGSELWSILIEHTYNEEHTCNKDVPNITILTLFFLAHPSYASIIQSIFPFLLRSLMPLASKKHPSNIEAHGSSDKGPRPLAIHHV